MMILYFQNTDAKKASFLYHQKDKSVDIYSRLSDKNKDSSLFSEIENICDKKECKKDILFDKEIEPLKHIDLIDKLVLFAKDKNISKATILTSKDGKLEINFLLKNRDDLNSLEKICKGYKDIKNNSSVIEIFSISKIEESINTVLKENDLKFDLSEPDANTQKVLKRVFRKLKELGKTDIVFWVNLSDDEIKSLKSYIKQNFNWIEKIEFIKDKINKIKIKEVLS